MQLRRIEKLAILALLAFGWCGCATPLPRATKPPDPSEQLWNSCVNYCADDGQEVRRVEIQDLIASCICRRAPSRS